MTWLRAYLYQTDSLCSVFLSSSSVVFCFAFLNFFHLLRVSAVSILVFCIGKGMLLLKGKIVQDKNYPGASCSISKSAPAGKARSGGRLVLVFAGQIVG
jgi:hypothetical protein